MDRHRHDPRPTEPHPQPEPDAPEPEDRRKRHAPPTPDALPPVTDPDSHLDSDAATEAEQEQWVHLEERHGESPGVAESASERGAGQSDPISGREPSPS